jgi:hypothetical protein
VYSHYTGAYIMNSEESEAFLDFAAEFLDRDKDEVTRTFISSFAPDEGLKKALVAFNELIADQEEIDQGCLQA